MKTTFIIEDGTPFYNGEVINVDGCVLKDRTPILNQFDFTNLIGWAKVEKKDGKLYATAEIDEGILQNNPHWAIGYQAIEQKKNVVKRCKVLCIGMIPKWLHEANIKNALKL